MPENRPLKASNNYEIINLITGYASKNRPWNGMEKMVRNDAQLIRNRCKSHGYRITATKSKQRKKFRKDGSKKFLKIPQNSSKFLNIGLEWTAEKDS